MPDAVKRLQDLGRQWQELGHEIGPWQPDWMREMMVAKCETCQLRHGAPVLALDVARELEATAKESLIGRMFWVFQASAFIEPQRELPPPKYTLRQNSESG